MITNKCYIKDRDQKLIKDYVELLEPGEKVRIKYVMTKLNGKYACFEIMQYIRSLGISQDKIFHGEAEYINELPRGHIRLTSEVFFENCYLHQYVVAKELDIDMNQVKKYVIHHQDEMKGNNSINNLWVFYDIASHVEYHQALKNNADIDIKEFTSKYIENISDDKNVEQIKQYLKILDKLEMVQNNKKCTYAVTAMIA